MPVPSKRARRRVCLGRAAVKFMYRIHRHSHSHHQQTLIYQAHNKWCILTAFVCSYFYTIFDAVAQRWHEPRHTHTPAVWGTHEIICWFLFLRATPQNTHDGDADVDIVADGKKSRTWNCIRISTRAKRTVYLLSTMNEYMGVWCEIRMHWRCYTPLNAIKVHVRADIVRRRWTTITHSRRSLDERGNRSLLSFFAVAFFVFTHVD